MTPYQCTVCILLYGGVQTYDLSHSLLISSEDDDPAVFTNRDDLWTAAHNACAGSIVTWVTVRSRPLVSNWYCLKDEVIKVIKAIQNTHEDMVYFKDVIYFTACNTASLFLRVPDCFGDGGKWWLLRWRMQWQSGLDPKTAKIRWSMSTSVILHRYQQPIRTTVYPMIWGLYRMHFWAKGPETTTCWCITTADCHKGLTWRSRTSPLCFWSHKSCGSPSNSSSLAEASWPPIDQKEILLSCWEI